MHKIVQNLINIQKEIKSNISISNYYPKIVAVSKTFSADYIKPLIDSGHVHFGENKVQEAVEKWTDIKSKNNQINLHMVGKLQTNKVKFALKIFDFIHSVDSIKLAKKISVEQKKYEKKPKIFIQINIGKELQKSGIEKNDLKEFYKSCMDLELNIIGTMCLPPDDDNSDVYFSEMQKLNKDLNLLDMSMGMSNDYLNAIKYNATYLRIGSKIFGQRS